MISDQQQQPPCPPGQDPSLDLDSKLKELEKDLQEEQGNLQKAEVEIKEREEQIKALSALINQIDDVVDNYRERHIELKEKEHDYREFCADEKTCLTNVLGTDTQKVCDTAKNVMVEIVDIGKEIEKLGVGCDNTIGGLEKAKRERVDREKTLALAKKEFEAWKDPVKSIETRFKDLEKMKKEICTEHEGKNYAIAYYLLMFGDECCASVQPDKPCESVEQEFFESYEKYCTRSNNPEDYPPEIADPGQLKAKIVAAWNAYQEADTAYNDQDAEVKRLEKKLELMKSQLAEKKKNFEKTIRRKLSELNQAQSSAA
jgi:chromosome segregation ATPase